MAEVPAKNPHDAALTANASASDGPASVPAPSLDALLPPEMTAKWLEYARPKRR
jgi:hypothetical protein